MQHYLLWQFFLLCTLTPVETSSFVHTAPMEEAAANVGTAHAAETDKVAIFTRGVCFIRKITALLNFWT